MSSKQLLLKPLMATALAGFLFTSSAVFGQVKIGSNPTVIGANENLEVEDASGTKTVITQDKGFVGIGTSAPVSRLNVHETIPPVFGSTVAAFTRPGNKFFLFETTATNGGYNPLVKDGDSHIIFSTDGDPAVAAEPNNGLVIAPWSLNPAGTGLKIMENGFVGVGTPAPTSKFSVFGGVSYFGIDPAPNFTGIVIGTSAKDGIGLGAQNGAASDGAIYVQRSGAANYSPLYLSRNAALGSGPGLLTAYSVSGTNVGTISTNGSTTSYNTTSDVRLKENIKATHYGLSDLMQIEVADYNYRTDKAKKRTTGFLAQELYKIFPEAVSVGGENAKTDPWTVDYGKLTPLLVKAVQEQQALINMLKAENDQFKKQVAEIIAVNDTLGKQVNTMETLAARLELMEAKLQVSSAGQGVSSTGK